MMLMFFLFFWRIRADDDGRRGCWKDCGSDDGPALDLLLDGSHLLPAASGGSEGPEVVAGVGGAPVEGELEGAGHEVAQIAQAE